MFRFESLDIWNLAIEYADLIYALTAKFPRDELFGLSSQLRRAAVSISCNIAEGSLSDSNKEFRAFLNYGIRSAGETVSEGVIARRRKYITNEDAHTIYQKAEVLVKKMTVFKKGLH